VVLLGYEVDVSDWQSKALFDDHEGPGLLVQLAETGVNSGGKTAAGYVLGVLLSKFTSWAKDEYRSGGSTKRDDLVEDSAGLCTARDTSECHHVLEVEVLRFALPQFEGRYFETGFEALLLISAGGGTFVTLLDENVVLFFCEISGADSWLDVCREAKFDSPFRRNGGYCPGCRFCDLFCSDDVITLEFKDGFTIIRVVIEEHFTIPFGLGDPVIAIMVFKEFQRDAIEDVIRLTFDNLLVLAFLVVVGDVDSDVRKDVEDGAPPTLGFSQCVKVISGEVEDATMADPLEH